MYLYTAGGENSRFIWDEADEGGACGSDATRKGQVLSLRSK
jgi:hypothetical protein